MPEEGGGLDDVAAATGLREGVRGVEEVLRQIQRLGAPPARTLSRRTGLPVPLVVAVSNELRRRDLLDRGRPSRLTAAGRALAARLGAEAGMACTCASCAGSGVVLAGEVAHVRRQLAEALRAAPPADRRLDQAHSTIDAKLRRIAYLEEAGALSGRSVLLLGDDDFLAVSLAVAVPALGLGAPARLTVVDVDPAVIGFTRALAGELGQPVELVRHDLRRPLPAGLLGVFDTVVTDPPYTTAGAELFCSRAADALRPGSGGQVMLCFGPKPPEEAAAVQHALTGMGLAIHHLVRNFNEYHGAGVLGGSSHLYHLVGGPRVAATVTGGWIGPLYTAEVRARDHPPPSRGRAGVGGAS